MFACGGGQGGTPQDAESLRERKKARTRGEISRVAALVESCLRVVDFARENFPSRTTAGARRLIRA